MTEPSAAIERIDEALRRLHDMYDQGDITSVDIAAVRSDWETVARDLRAIVPPAPAAMPQPPDE